MREIKFRGMTIDDKKMVYGDLLQYRVLPVIFDEDKEQHDVGATSLGQYTGLKDRDGKEIYEGDIIRWYPNRPKNYNDEIVEYIGNAFSLGGWYEGDYPDTEKYCKVIGNIYENPELLKLEKEKV